MKCIILCAGYATRLKTYLKDMPKALIKIGEKTIIDYEIEQINGIKEIDEIYIVTNEKYYKKFIEWEKCIKSSKPIKIINDNTKTSEERLGAIGDIKYVIDNQKISDDIIVMASDNVFDFSLREMIDLFNQKDGAVICTKEIEDRELLKRLAVLTLNQEGQVTKLIEKPENPESNIAAFTTYVYKKEVIDLIDKYLKEENNPDAPGYFVEWLYKKYPVYAYQIKGECYDVGTYETLLEVTSKYKTFSKT